MENSSQNLPNQPVEYADQRDPRVNLRNLRGRKRIEYIWNYYKVPLGVLLVGTYIVVWIIYHNLTAKIPEFYLSFVNVSAGETLYQELTDDFLPELNTGNPRSIVYTYRDLLLTANVDSTNMSFVQACQMKILAGIEGETMDLVYMDKEAFDAFAQNGYLYNMEDFLKEYAPAQLDSLGEYMVSNIEILTDNHTEMYFNPDVQYESTYVEYPMALNLSFCPPVTEAGFGQDIYIGVIRNCPRLERAGLYINYLDQLQ